MSRVMHIPVVDEKRVAIAAAFASASIPPRPTAVERAELIERIQKMLQEQDAVLVAHYYTDKDLQDLADETGGYVSDSLDMARFGNEHPAQTLVVAGGGVGRKRGGEGK